MIGDLPRKAPMLAIAIRSMLALSLLGLAGCEHSGFTTDIEVVPHDPVLTGEAAEVLSRSPIRSALDAYHRGDFGLAERSFRAAVEHNPRDARAWIGLAASYDQLRRFELADRAYGEAIQLSGETAQIMNNLGYSLLLRGDRRGAQAKFAVAARLRPDDATVANNMKLIDSREVKIPH
jgi:Flp pilus assembly protein TadD